jgi:UDP:flavonoid glycosyltransferase YjiC (YdhE family)
VEATAASRKRSLTEEKPHTGMLAEMSGAGINLRTQTPGVEQLRSTVLEMLRNPGFSRKAQELGRAYKEADPVGMIAEAVEEVSGRFFGDGSM